MRYDQTEKSLKKFLLAAVAETYVRSLRHKHVGCANVNALIILSYLYDSYAKSTAQDLKENDKRFNTAYDPNDTMESTH